MAIEEGLLGDETGQMVVEIAIVEVTTTVEWAGQFVTVAAQLVMVISVVVKDCGCSQRRYTARAWNRARRRCDGRTAVRGWALKSATCGEMIRPVWWLR